jgi:exosortase A
MIAPPAGQREKTSAWPAALAALALALALIVAAFFDTAAGMVAIWARSDTFAHGFVVAPISLWLIWRMRARLRLFEPRPSWIALPVIAAAAFAWLLGNVGAVNAVSQIAFVSILVLAVPAILGVRLTRAMLFPLGFLFFSVPIGEFLIPTLMAHTADFTIAALRASGVPVYREGMQFVVPNGRWSVVEACSGVRYLIASLVVGTLFAYISYTTMGRRLAFVGISIAVPIVANWLRAYLIVMLGYLSDNKIATGVDHLVYGWLFFGVVMLVMFAIGSRWQQSTRSTAAGDGIPIGVESSVRSARRPSFAWFGSAALAVVATASIAPVAAWTLDRNGSEPSATLAAVAVPGWQASSPPEPGFAPGFVKPSAVRHQLFRRNERVLGLYLGYYRGQNADRKLVSSNSVMLPSTDRYWHALSTGVRPMNLAGDSVSVVSGTIRGAAGETLETRQWYWIGGALTSSDAVAKARIAWRRLTGRGDDSAVIVVYTPVADGVGAETTLQSFMREAWPSIAAVLSDTRENR